jgi:hypothetical protein
VELPAALRQRQRPGQTVDRGRSDADLEAAALAATAKRCSCALSSSTSTSSGAPGCSGSSPASSSLPDSVQDASVATGRGLRSISAALPERLRSSATSRAPGREATPAAESPSSTGMRRPPAAALRSQAEPSSSGSGTAARNPRSSSASASLRRARSPRRLSSSAAFPSVVAWKSPESSSASPPVTSARRTVAHSVRTSSSTPSASVGTAVTTASAATVRSTARSGLAGSITKRARRRRIPPALTTT